MIQFVQIICLCWNNFHKALRLLRLPSVTGDNVIHMYHKCRGECGGRIIYTRDVEAENVRPYQAFAQLLLMKFHQSSLLCLQLQVLPGGLDSCVVSDPLFNYLSVCPCWLRRIWCQWQGSACVLTTDGADDDEEIFGGADEDLDVAGGVDYD